MACGRGPVPNRPPVSTTRTIDGTDYTTAAAYDSLGRVLSTTLPTGEVVYTAYNARGLPETLSGIDTYVASTDYTPTGGIDSQTLGNGVINDFTYDATTNRLSALLIQKPAVNALVDLAYTYDDAGNITAIDDAVNGEDRTYGYDDLDRLTWADVSDGSTTVDERDYTYDSIGNLLSFTAGASATIDYTYPSGTNAE